MKEIVRSIIAGVMVAFFFVFYIVEPSLGLPKIVNGIIYGVIIIIGIWEFAKALSD